MKITEMSDALLEDPLPTTVKTGRFQFPNAYLPVVRLRSDVGHEWLGWGAVLKPGFAKPLALLIDGLRDVVVGQDAAAPHALYNAVAAQVYKAGPLGMATWALAAIDVAGWDLMGKVADMPLYRLLGGTRQSLPAYSLIGLTHDDDAGLLRDADTQIEAGFKFLKVFVGGIKGPHDTAKDIARRVRTVKEHVGPDIRLAMDNQELWTPNEAIRLAKEVEDLDLFWFEEPCPHTDLVGIGEVCDTILTPVCAGEQLFGIHAMHELMRIGHVDILEVDVRMIGGVTPFMKAAAMAEVQNKAIANHMMTGIDRHLLAAAGKPAVLEFVPWSDYILEEGQLELVDGEVRLPEGPGLGCTHMAGIVEKYGM
jgi:L-alanine-DL-glutamate epimerase-like enolase superfamily enzyme